MTFTVRATFNLATPETGTERREELALYAERVMHALADVPAGHGVGGAPKVTVDLDAEVLEVELDYEVADATTARRAAVQRLHSALVYAGTPPKVEAVQLSLTVHEVPAAPGGIPQQRERPHLT